MALSSASSISSKRDILVALDHQRNSDFLLTSSTSRWLKGQPSWMPKYFNAQERESGGGAGFASPKPSLLPGSYSSSFLGPCTLHSSSTRCVWKMARRFTPAHPARLPSARGRLTRPLVISSALIAARQRFKSGMRTSTASCNRTDEINFRNQPRSAPTCVARCPTPMRYRIKHFSRLRPSCSVWHQSNPLRPRG